MPKKDYVLIAKTLNYSRGYIEAIAVDRIASLLASELQADNSKFKPDVFLKACGVQS